MYPAGVNLAAGRTAKSGAELYLGVDTREDALLPSGSVFSGSWITLSNDEFEGVAVVLDSPRIEMPTDH